MKSSTKISLTLFLIPVLTCLGIGMYYMKLSLSENMEFERNSIEYRLLTPNILKDIPTEDIGKVSRYYYSAAEGDKPLINAVELVSGKEKERLENIIMRYFLHKQFIINKHGKIVKDDEEITLTFEKNDSNEWVIRITLAEIIK